jgi:class 3 adenylate cyclase
VVPLGVQVRAGLNTGEVERSESDIQGIAVHLAARIMSEAAAGEAVVSRTVKDLIAGSGIEVDDKSAALAEFRVQVARLRKRLAEVVSVDFFGAIGRETAEGSKI